MVTSHVGLSLEMLPVGHGGVDLSGRAQAEEMEQVASDLSDHRGWTARRRRAARKRADPVVRPAVEDASAAFGIGIVRHVRVGSKFRRNIGLHLF